MVAGSRLRMEHVSSSFARAALFVFLSDPSAVNNTQGRGPDDSGELLSFEAFGFLLLISSGQIDFY